MEIALVVLLVLLVIVGVGWAATWLLLSRQVNRIHQAALSLDVENRRLRSRLEEALAKAAYQGASDEALLGELRRPATGVGAARAGVRPASGGAPGPGGGSKPGP